MSQILGPDGMPATREKGAFGPPTLDDFPTYSEEHWVGLDKAAESIYGERMTVLLSTPMAMMRADFVQLAVNVKRQRDENTLLRQCLQDVIEAEARKDVVSLGRALASAADALKPSVSVPSTEQ